MSRDIEQDNNKHQERSDTTAEEALASINTGQSKPKLDPEKKTKQAYSRPKSSTHDPETTSHEWDGIKEFRNPDPGWLRVLFYICLFFSFAYWILYPSWPTPGDRGLLQWSSTEELQSDLIEIMKIRQKHQDQFDKSSFEQVFSDEQLLNFAMFGGKSAFNNNCAVCHGIGGGGNPGYPNLTAGAWLWGGKIEDIYTTIQHGIRSGDPEARDSQMPSFGKDGTLKPEEVSLLAQYVMEIGGLQSKVHKLTSGAETTILAQYDKAQAAQLFVTHCASCHGNEGKGNQDVGAPNLIDAIWLYGSSYDIIYDVIYNGRDGVMPHWKDKLSDSTIRQLAIYVHQLGGGK